MNLNELRDEVHAVAVEHGWWETPPSFGEIIALCHSELSEAMEEYRDGKPMVYCDAYKGNAECNGLLDCSGVECFSVFRGRKPEGIATELADCIIRILDYCGHEGIDIDATVRIKHEYNKTRPYRHGGKKL